MTVLVPVLVPVLLFGSGSIFIPFALPCSVAVSFTMLVFVPLPFSIPVPVTISPMSIPVPLGVAAASTTAITTRSGFSDEQLRIKCCQILMTVKHRQ